MENRQIYLIGDVIIDNISIINERKIHSDVVTVNNDDVITIMRKSGVYFIKQILESFYSNDKVSSDILFVNIYTKDAPVFNTYEKWREETTADNIKYYFGQFNGSSFEKMNEENFCKKFEALNEKSDELKNNTKKAVLSIFDRYNSVLMKREKSAFEEDAHDGFSDVSYNNYYNDLFNGGFPIDYIVLRSKYNKFIDVDNNKALYNDEVKEYHKRIQRKYRSSPFFRITEKCELCQKTILITSLRELRDMDVYIPENTTWDDVLISINNMMMSEDSNDGFERLRKIKHIIIDLSSDGMLIIENTKQNPEDPPSYKYSLIANPSRIDNSNQNYGDENNLHNKLTGYLSWVQAYITYQLSRNDTIDIGKLSKWCKEAHITMLYLDSLGFVGVDYYNKAYDKKTIKPKSINMNLAVLAAVVSKGTDSIDLKKYTKNICVCTIDSKAISEKNFSLVSYSLKNIIDKSKKSDHHPIHSILGKWIIEIVKYGFDKFIESAVKNDNVFIPYVKYGECLSIDKDEINGLRNFERNLRDYLNNNTISMPLSIGVFGAPGAGKSYSIKQITECVLGKGNTITFNVSQMDSPDDIIDALRIVQSKVIDNKIPVVFWDEFDSSMNGEELGWLKYFLSPMWDGQYLYQQNEFLIGKCVFIFAGGTCSTHLEFVDKCQEIGMKKVKAPDFLGRLKAILNIPSLNPDMKSKKILAKEIRQKQLLNIEKDFMCSANLFNADYYEEYLILKGVIKVDENKFENLSKKYQLRNVDFPVTIDTDDYNKNLFLIRRAMILRASLQRRLEKKSTDVIEIDDALISAFMRIDEYYYDSRSIDSIVKCYHIEHSKFSVRSSGILPEQQLNLHVNGKRFIKYLNEYKDGWLFGNDQTTADVLEKNVKEDNTY